MMNKEALPLVGNISFDVNGKEADIASDFDLYTTTATFIETK